MARWWSGERRDTERLQQHREPLLEAAGLGPWELRGLPDQAELGLQMWLDGSGLSRAVRTCCPHRKPKTLLHQLQADRTPAPQHTHKGALPPVSALHLHT